MQNVIVGTSGHVDHGKTCLIKALTGVDTDRLKEEQKRGITIELGFAKLPTEGDVRVGIIDVPGHEKFVKNMLAGIGGIDLVLLVIALDEGVMPQTVEHFEILKMLNIRQGIIAFTKMDMVEEGWADLVEEDVTELVKGSFLESAERIRVSAYTGRNIDQLKRMILNKVCSVSLRREAPELFRLPIDRVFSMDGFGTVVTGTLIEGSLKVGDEVMIYPQMQLAKVRGIQNHGEMEEFALAGQRTAINLAGVKKEDLECGQVLASPGAITNSFFLDAKVSIFQTAERQLKNGSRVHLNYGSAQTVAKVVLLEQDSIGPGESGWVQFRLDSPIAVRRKDRFIIRFYSPVETFGGGVILDVCPGKHKRKQSELLEALKIKEMGSEDDVLELTLKEESMKFPTVHDLAQRLNETDAETKKRLELLKKQKKAICLNNESYLHRSYWEKVSATAQELLSAYHNENPIAAGMEKEEFKSRLLGRLYHTDSKSGEVLLYELMKRGVMTASGSTVALCGFSAQYSDVHSSMRATLIQRYLNAGVEAPDTNSVLAQLTDKEQAKQVLSDLINEGILVKLSPGACLSKDYYEKALSLLQEHFKEHSTLSLGEYRDLLKTSRKYVLLILEHLDRKKITKLQGDVRVLLK